MDETMDSGRIGSSFDDFLDAEGIREEVEELAIKALIADQLRRAIEAEGLSKTAMARRMRTSRQQLDRLLDPKNPAVTLSTLRRAAKAVGRTLSVELI